MKKDRYIVFQSNLRAWLDRFSFIASNGSETLIVSEDNIYHLRLKSIMTRKEEERVEAERQRMRRLMSEGHISARELRAGKLFQTPPKCSGKPRKTYRPNSQRHSCRKQKTAKVVTLTFFNQNFP